MSERGKQSAASLAIAGPVGVVQRLSPPVALTPEQKVVWVTVTNAMPADWFAPEHIVMLTQYVRHKAQADIIAQQIENFNIGWLADDDGMKRYEKLGAMLERETRTLNALDRSMRLTQQSKIRADKVVKTQAGRKPWQKDD